MKTELEQILDGDDVEDDDVEESPEEEAVTAAPLPVLQATSTYELVRNLYKNDYGTPFEMTLGQNEIFDCIFMKGANTATAEYPGGKRRMHFMTLTQYGKSDTVSMAVLTRVATFPEKWALVAPSQAKAKIIMAYLIKHVFENEYTLARFKLDPGENEDMIRRERSKNRLTFDIGNGQIGEVFILSAESRLKRGEDMGNALMGFGAPNLIEDESALISDESDAKAMRMVGGFTGQGMDFVVKIGNPFSRGHFLKAYEDPAYHKININWERAVKEGRLTQAFIDEMRVKPFFRVLYENQFPIDGDIDAHGWTQLIGESEVESAMLSDADQSLFREGKGIKHIGEKRIGNDVARGGSNETVWAMRSMNFLEILAKSHGNNLTETAGQTAYFMREKDVRAENVFIDDVGVGGGAVDPLKAEQKNVRGVNVGQAALEDSRFANIRAEAYWRFREWIKKGGKLSRDDDWYQLCKIKYKPDSKGRLRVMSKDDMRALGIDSPDVADAGMLTFVRKEHGDMESRKKARDKKKKKRHEGRGLKVSMGGY